MKVHVTNGVKSLVIYGDFKTKYIQIVASRNMVTITPMDNKPSGKTLGRVATISRPDGRTPFTSIPRLKSSSKFGKTEFEAKENPNGSFFIDLSEPINGFAPARNYASEKPAPKVKDTTDADIQAAVSLINALDRSVYGVAIRTTDHKVVVNRITTFE